MEQYYDQDDSFVLDDVTVRSSELYESRLITIKEMPSDGFYLAHLNACEDGEMISGSTCVTIRDGSFVHFAGIFSTCLLLVVNRRENRKLCTIGLGKNGVILVEILQRAPFLVTLAFEALVRVQEVNEHLAKMETRLNELQQEFGALASKPHFLDSLRGYEAGNRIEPNL